MEISQKKLDIREVVKGAAEAREEWLDALNDIRDPAKRAEVKELIDRFTNDTKRFVEEYHRGLDQMAERYEQQQAALAEADALLAQGESFEPPSSAPVAAPAYDPAFGDDLRKSLLHWYRPPEPTRHPILQHNAFSEWAMETGWLNAPTAPFAEPLSPTAASSSIVAPGFLALPAAASAAAGWTAWLSVERADLTVGTATAPSDGPARAGVSPLQSVVFATGNMAPTSFPAGWNTWIESRSESAPRAPLSPFQSMVITTGAATSDAGAPMPGEGAFGWNTWMTRHAAPASPEPKPDSHQAESPQQSPTWKDLLQ